MNPEPCTNCGTREGIITRLHLEKGGPWFCLPCGMEWHGEYGRRRKLGRVVIKAIAAYMQAGGAFQDLRRLELAASGFPLGGYEVEADTIGAEIGDITAELLQDVLVLTHPDRHPPERRDLATRVTSELLALQPFVFPAPKREEAPVEDDPASRRDESLNVTLEALNDALRGFPCSDCVETVPSFYCDPCRMEWNKRARAGRERKNAKQREWYRRRQCIRRSSAPRHCRICGTRFLEKKRAGAAHCSAACRQRAYRQRRGAVATEAQTGGAPA